MYLIVFPFPVINDNQKIVKVKLKYLLSVDILVYECCLTLPSFYIFLQNVSLLFSNLLAACLICALVLDQKYFELLKGLLESEKLFLTY